MGEGKERRSKEWKEEERKIGKGRFLMTGREKRNCKREKERGKGDRLRVKGERRGDERIGSPWTGVARD